MSDPGGTKMWERLEPGELPGWAEPGTGGDASGPFAASSALLTGGGAAGIVCPAARRSAASCSFSGSAAGVPMRVEVSAFAIERNILAVGV